ncbi:unnamed protein product [Brugia pahangi]|uniref:MARVEL domain-containing protein n=1 Tax=Brugia pahangi TaxID=6280 RepID=A0A0N4T708_BRUPA|nr:unnamed protein product [Brugia pahangi]
MIATLIIEISSLILVAITFCACCCREFWIFLLPLLAFLATVTLAIALFIYTRNNNTAFEILNENEKIASEAYHINFFYSYYLAWIALTLMTICILIEILNENEKIASEAYHINFFYSYYLAWIALTLMTICILIGAFAKKLAQILNY